MQCPAALTFMHSVPSLSIHNMGGVVSGTAYPVVTSEILILIRHSLRKGYYRNGCHFCGFYQYINPGKSLINSVYDLPVLIHDKIDKKPDTFAIPHLQFQIGHICFDNIGTIAHLFFNLHQENSSKIPTQWIYQKINAILNLILTKRKKKKKKKKKKKNALN